MDQFKRQAALKLALGIYLLGIGLVTVQAGSVASEGAHEHHGFEKAGGAIMDILASPMKAASKHHHEGQKVAEATGSYEEHHEGEQEHEVEHIKDPLYLISETAKLMLNPIALVKKISHEFNLPKGKLIEKVGKGLVYGTEALFSPVIACLKIIEKVFVPDVCRLKFVCQFGSRLDFMKETMLKLSPNFLEGSSHLKALSHGIVGRDCAHTFADCEPTLRDSYKDLNDHHDHHHHHHE